MQGARMRAAPGTSDLRWQRWWHAEAAPLSCDMLGFGGGRRAHTPCMDLPYVGVYIVDML